VGFCHLLVARQRSLKYKLENGQGAASEVLIT